MKIRTTLAVVIAALALAGMALAGGGFQYRYRVPTPIAAAFARGAHIPLSQCGFIKQHRVFGCIVSRRKREAVYLTVPRRNWLYAYAVRNGRIIKVVRRHVAVSGLTA